MDLESEHRFARSKAAAAEQSWRRFMEGRNRQHRRARLLLAVLAALGLIVYAFLRFGW